MLKSTPYYSIYFIYGVGIFSCFSNRILVSAGHVLATVHYLHASNIDR